MFRRLYEEMQVELMDKHPYDDIVSSLNKIQNKFENHESVDWKFLRPHIGMAKPSKRLSPDFRGFIFMIFQQLLTRYQCRDLSIIADALQIYSFVLEGSKRSFQKARMMTDNFIKNEACCDIEGLNFVSKLMKMPYKPLCFLPYEPMFDVIQMAILTREVHHLKYFLEFGVMYIPLSDHESTWNHCFQRLSVLLNKSEKKMLVNLHDFQNNIGNLDPASRQRMLAVFRAVDFIIKSRDTLLGVVDYKICFKMAFETIPEPLITSQEVSNFLYYVLSGPSADKFIKAQIKDYESVFPESTAPLAPRSLKHLSRCQVRQNFREAGTFPYGILDSNYPQALKDYILAKLDHNFVRAEYNSYFNFGDMYAIGGSHI